VHLAPRFTIIDVLIDKQRAHLSVAPVAVVATGYACAHANSHKHMSPNRLHMLPYSGYFRRSQGPGAFLGSRSESLVFVSRSLVTPAINLNLSFVLQLYLQ